MNKLQQYIQEKLKITSKTKINSKIDVDEMNRQEICLSDMKQNKGKFLQDILRFVENNLSYKGFLLSRYKELSEYIKEENSQNIAYHMSLEMLLEDIREDMSSMNEVWIEYGRIFIKEKTGRKRKYYIYALSKEGYNKCEEVFYDMEWNERRKHDISFMLESDFIKEIKYEENE